jgi:hypothetical protein
VIESKFLRLNLLQPIRLVAGIVDARLTGMASSTCFTNAASSVIIAWSYRDDGRFLNRWIYANATRLASCRISLHQAHKSRFLMLKLLLLLLLPVAPLTSLVQSTACVMLNRNYAHLTLILLHDVYFTAS